MGVRSESWECLVSARRRSAPARQFGDAFPIGCAPAGELSPRPYGLGTCLLAFRFQPQDGDLGLPGEVDCLAEDAASLLGGVKALRILRNHEVEPPLRLAVKQARILEAAGRDLA